MQITVCNELIISYNSSPQTKSLCLPMGGFCVEEQHTVSSYVSEAAEEPLGQTQ